MIHFNRDAVAVNDYQIQLWDVAQIFMSPSPYNDAFEKYIDMKRFHPTNLPAGGLQVHTIGDRLILGSITKGSLCSKLKDWCSRLKGAWLIRLDNINVHTLADINVAFNVCLTSGSHTCTLLFFHPEVHHGLTNKGIPQVTLDQLNPHLLFESFMAPQPPECKCGCIPQVWDGKVLHYVTQAQRLTCGCLIKQDDWAEWNSSEFMQLDLYEAQGMFGSPQHITTEETIFNLVWTNDIKGVNNRKKAHCTCDGSPHSGQVCILNFTYANCTNQTSTRIFYAVSAVENLIIHGADVVNVFAEAPTPKQGFFICPDKAFHDWWVNHKHWDPIAPGAVIPVLSAMQGHPEAPRLWE
jgi:hypothetical protein